MKRHLVELGATDLHDVAIYAICFDETRRRLLLDIDYLEVAADSSQAGGSQVEFSVGAAVLCFDEVFDIEFDFGSVRSILEIDRLSFESRGLQPDEPIRCVLELQEGRIAVVCATGWLELCEPLKRLTRTRRSLDERGGVFPCHD